MQHAVRFPRPATRRLAVLALVSALLASGTAFAASTIRPSEYTVGHGTLWQYLIDHSAHSLSPVCYRSSPRPSESYNCLQAALKVTGIDKTLRADGPYTLFAPTDAGFAELAHLMGPVAFQDLVTHRDKLRVMLQNLIVPGRYTSGDLKARAVPATGAVRLTTLAGSELELTFGRFASGNGRVTVKVGHAFLQPGWVPYLVGTTTVLDNGAFQPMDMVYLPPSLR